MFVVNFDFSPFNFFPKLLAINIPVVLTQLLTYPLQRLQTQLIRKETYITSNQFKQIPLCLAQMFKVEGFPKCYHGLRYSLDYAITLMTLKFITFDILMITDWADSNRFSMYLSCMAANLLATVASQSAFNYQTIASSLQTNFNNNTESVKKRLIKFTENKSALRNGLKYTLPISAINGVIELLAIINLQGKFGGMNTLQPQNELALQKTGYQREELIIASIVLGLTSATNHFAVQRQIELCFDVKTRYKYLKGFVGTLLRNMSKGMLLYYIYFRYFDWLIAKEIENQFEKRQVHNILPNYYKGRKVE